MGSRRAPRCRAAGGREPEPADSRRRSEERWARESPVGAAARSGSSGAPSPVLLVPGTGGEPEDNSSGTTSPRSTKLGIPWCAVDAARARNGDIQVDGEYVVNAIRTMYARAGRRIAIVGHSQGGMVAALGAALLARHARDGRRRDRLRALQPRHDAGRRCVLHGSAARAADWQQRDDSKFIAALNSAPETFAGISYTNIYTHTDEIVQPEQRRRPAARSLHTGDGRDHQRRDPGHLPATTPTSTSRSARIDPVAYALAIDALDHDGPADPSASTRSVCAQPFQPGVNPATFPADAAAAYAKVLDHSARL